MNREQITGFSETAKSFDFENKGFGHIYVSSQQSLIHFEKGSDMIGILFQKINLASYQREKSVGEKERE